jgi:hypothetical protein
MQPKTEAGKEFAGATNFPEGNRGQMESPTPTCQCEQTHTEKKKKVLWNITCSSTP